jgi:hypothetical protein
VGVEDPRAFAGVGQADADLGARRAGEPAAAEQALEVNGEIEVPVTQAAGEGAQRLEGAPTPPGLRVRLAVEEDHLVQHGVPVEDAGAGRRDEPTDAGLGPLAAEQVQHRQAVHDVADGAGLNDQDVAGCG